MLAKGIEHNTMIKKHKDTIRVIVVENNLDKKSRMQKYCLMLSFVISMLALAVGIYYGDISKIVFSMIIGCFCFALQFFVVADNKEYYGKVD